MLRFFVDDIKNIIDTGIKSAYTAANSAAVITYWHIGKRIVEEEQKGNVRASYGTQLIKRLAQELTAIYGRTYSKRNLDYYRQFYLKFGDLEIVNACVHNLSWTHFRRLLTVTNPIARNWYAIHAAQDMWSSRTLDRHISTQYCERRLSAHLKLDLLPVTNSDKTPPEEIMSYLPSEAELRAEIDRQKQFFLEQHPEKQS